MLTSGEIVEPQDVLCIRNLKIILDDIFIIVVSEVRLRFVGILEPCRRIFSESVGSVCEGLETKLVEVFKLYHDLTLMIEDLSDLRGENVCPFLTTLLGNHVGVQLRDGSNDIASVFLDEVNVLESASEE